MKVYYQNLVFFLSSNSKIVLLLIFTECVQINSCPCIEMQLSKLTQKMQKQTNITLKCEEKAKQDFKAEGSGII